MTTLPPVSFAVTLAAVSLIAPLAVHLFFPAIPVIKAELGISDAEAQLAFGISLFAMGISTLVYGTLADRFGRRPVLLSGLFMFLVGSVVSAMADSLGLLVLGRLIQAVGAGCGTTLVRTIARDAYGQEHLVKAIAYLTMAYTLGPMLAPLIGGLLIDTLGWRTLFVLAYVCGGAIMASAILVIEETRPPRRTPAEQVGVWRSYATLITQLRFNAYILQTAFNSASFLVMAAATSVFMKEMLNRPATEFGLYFLAFPLGFLAGNFITTRIGHKVARDTMVLAGSLIAAACVAAQSAVLMAGYVTPLSLCLPGFVISLAQGISMPSGQAAAIALAPRHAGTASGLGVFAQMMVGGFAVQIFGLLADGSVEPFIWTIAATGAATLVFGLVPALMPPPRPDNAGMAGPARALPPSTDRGRSRRPRSASGAR